jgi:hypothetical protein
MMNIDNMQCLEFERTLEQQPDGPLSMAASQHKESCGECRLLWADMDAIRAAGRELGADLPAPPARIWAALRSQLESEGLIREQSRTYWFADWFGAPHRWALASISISVVLIAAGAVVSYWSYQPTPAVFQSERVGVEMSPAPELGQALDSDMKRVLASLPEQNPSLAASLQSNLGIVDNLIAVCEQSVREQPDSAAARDYLYGAYRQKAVLLATATDRSTMEDR